MRKGNGFGAVAAGLVLAAGSASAATETMPPLPPELEEKVAQAQAACADFDGGTFAMEWSAVQRVDLDGDLVPDWVLNENGFSCSSAVSIYGGTGGSLSHFLVAGALSSILNQGWQVATIGPHRVVFADVHGANCGGINPTPCVTASVWDRQAKAWRSATAQWE